MVRTTLRNGLFSKSGPDRRIHAFDITGGMLIRFERPFKPKLMQKGKLIQFVETYRRGRIVNTDVLLSPEAEEALFAILEKRRIDRIRRTHEAEERAHKDQMAKNVTLYLHMKMEDRPKRPWWLFGKKRAA